MSEDAQAQLAVALGAVDKPTAAFQALQAAFAWSLEVLEKEALADRRAALSATAALDAALSAADGLDRAVQRLLQCAEPGPSLEADLERRQEELAGMAEQVATLR